MPPSCGLDVPGGRNRCAPLVSLPSCNTKYTGELHHNFSDAIGNNTVNFLSWHTTDTPGGLILCAWVQRVHSQMPPQCGRGWQLWYSKLHAEILRRPSPEQRLAVVQVTYNGLGDRLASIVSVFWFAAVTGLLLLLSSNDT